MLTLFTFPPSPNSREYFKGGQVHKPSVPDSAKCRSHNLNALLKDQTEGTVHGHHSCGDGRTAETTVLSAGNFLAGKVFHNKVNYRAFYSFKNILYNILKSKTQ